MNSQFDDPTFEPVYVQADDEKWPYRLVKPLMMLGVHHEIGDGLICNDWWTKKPTKFSSRAEIGAIILADGYACDGPSIPGIGWVRRWFPKLTDRIVYTLLRGAFLHDAGYQALRDGWIPVTRHMRALIDREYLRLIREDGTGWIRSWYQYRALRLVGWKAAKMRWHQ